MPAGSISRTSGAACNPGSAMPPSATRGNSGRNCWTPVFWCQRNTAEMRCGSWNNNPENVRVSNRNRNEPTNRNNNIGFRCAG